MNKTFYMLISLLLVSIFLAACNGDSGSQRLPQNSDGDVAQAKATPAQATAGDPAAGKEDFEATCAACHGPAGEGIAGLGKAMTTSEFIAGMTDDELVDFIKVGRDPGDPLNTTGVGMPPKGGNPALRDEDLQNIIAYIRTLQK
jgi:disulfide bond formation protein DsbB